MSEGVASTHTCALPTLNASTWVEIVGRITLLNHLHVAVFVLVLLVTYMCSAEFLALRKKDLVPPLVLPLPCWSVEIAASKNGMSTRGPRRVGAHGPARASMGLQAPDHVQNTPQWSQHRSNARFHTFARSAKTRSVESFHCRRIRQKQSSGSLPPLCCSPAPTQIETTGVTCRGEVDEASASPAVHERMTGNVGSACSVDVAFWRKRQIIWDCVAMCSTQNLVPRYDVTKPLVLARIGQDVSAGKCVAKVMSPPRKQTSCSSKVLAASASVANLLHCARMPWILEPPFDSWFWDVPKIQTLAAEPRTAWALTDFCVFWDLHAESENRDLHRIARKCAGIGGRCSVSGQKDVQPKASASRSEFCSSRDHTRPARLSFELAMSLTMNARRFQKTHPLRLMGDYSLKRVKGDWYGSC